MKWKFLSLCVLISIVLYQLVNFQQVKVTQQSTVIHQNDQAFEVKPLGFFANFFANFLAKLAESEKGQELVIKIFKPLNAKAGQENLVSNNFNYIETIFSIDPKNEKQDDKIAYCGAQVLVDYKIMQADKLIVAEEDKQLQLYNNPIPAIDSIIVGMKQGESRKAVIPYWYAGSLKNYMQQPQEKTTGLAVEIKLKKIISPNVENVRIFDNMADASNVLLCGQTVQTRVKITNLKNQLLFNKSLNLSIGKPEAPIIFSYALFNKLPAAKRSVLAPAKYLFNQAGLLDQSLQSATAEPEDLILIEFE